MTVAGVELAPGGMNCAMSGFCGRLPRLSGLLVFEAAARHLNFTNAARELKVTQAAVSQQVRALETELGVALFLRYHRGLELTQEGHRLYRAAAMSLECLATATDDIRASNRPTIRIGITSAIATFWLVPRLPAFRGRHPEIDVHIVASELGFQAVADRADVGIAFGRGTWPGFRASFLREGDAFPVCSPVYLLSRPPLVDVAQLLDEVLLVMDDNRVTLIDWSLWFASHGIRNTNRRRIRFNSLPLLLQAACEGQGIGLGWSLLTDDLLTRGALVRPVNASLRTRGAYYLVVAENRSGPEIQAFQSWILEQFPVSQPVVEQVVGTVEVPNGEFAR
jgi:LysR family transcriptional regulator, glycine cleavage system transcriptional activator